MPLEQYGDYDSGLPSEDEVVARLRQQNELLAQGTVPIYGFTQDAVDYQADQLDTVRKRIAQSVRYRNGKQQKLLDRVQEGLQDSVSARAAAQQSLVDLTAARIGTGVPSPPLTPAATGPMSAPPSFSSLTSYTLDMGGAPPVAPPVAPPPPVSAPSSPGIIQPTGPPQTYTAWYRCSDGSRRALNILDNVMRSQLAASGYLEYPDRYFNDPYTPISFYDSSVGAEWIKLHCFPQGQIPTSPPPPPLGPPPPPIGTPPPPPGAYGLIYHCDPFDLKALPTNADVTQVLDGKYQWVPDGPTFPDQQSAYVASLDPGTQATYMIQLCPTQVIPTPPPGCCPHPDWITLFKYLCKCLKDNQHGNADLDQPLLFLFDERGEQWRDMAIAYYGPLMQQAIAAPTYDELRKFVDQLGG